MLELYVEDQDVEDFLKVGKDKLSETIIRDLSLKAVNWNIFSESKLVVTGNKTTIESHDGNYWCTLPNTHELLAQHIPHYNHGCYFEFKVRERGAG